MLPCPQGNSYIFNQTCPCYFQTEYLNMLNKLNVTFSLYFLYRKSPLWVNLQAQPDNRLRGQGMDLSSVRGNFAFQRITLGWTNMIMVTNNTSDISFNEYWDKNGRMTQATKEMFFPSLFFLSEVFSLSFFLADSVNA